MVKACASPRGFGRAAVSGRSAHSSHGGAPEAAWRTVVASLALLALLVFLGAWWWENSLHGFLWSFRACCSCPKICTITQRFWAYNLQKIFELFEGDVRNPNKKGTFTDPCHWWLDLGSWWFHWWSDSSVFFGHVLGACSMMYTMMCDFIGEVIFHFFLIWLIFFKSMMYTMMCCRSPKSAKIMHNREDVKI